MQVKPDNRSVIRLELIDSFQRKADYAKKQRLPSVVSVSLLSLLGGAETLERIRKQLLVAAIHALAERPEPRDRELFRNFLSPRFDDIELTVAALRGLSLVGHADDREPIFRLLTTDLPVVNAAAARAYLVLSPNRVIAVKDLVSQPTPYLLWSVIRDALISGDRKVWPVLKPLLAHDDEDIRRLVCYYVVKSQSHNRIETLLKKYLKRSSYYYNVATLLDRALYAPPILRRLFLSDEETFFQGWKPNET